MKRKARVGFDWISWILSVREQNKKRGGQKTTSFFLVYNIQRSLSNGVYTGKLGIFLLLLGVGSILRLEACVFFSLQLIYYIKKRERTGAMNSMEIHTLIFLLWGFCTYVRLLQQEKRVPGKRKPIYGRMSDSQGKKNYQIE